MKLRGGKVVLKTLFLTYKNDHKQYVTTCNINTANDHLQQAFSDPIVLDAHTLDLQASFFKFNFTTKNFSSSIHSHLMCNQNLERGQDVVCSGLVASFHE